MKYRTNHKIVSIFIARVIALFVVLWMPYLFLKGSHALSKIDDLELTCYSNFDLNYVEASLFLQDLNQLKTITRNIT